MCVDIFELCKRAAGNVIYTHTYKPANNAMRKKKKGKLEQKQI